MKVRRLFFYTDHPNSIFDLHLSFFWVAIVCIILLIGQIIAIPVGQLVTRDKFAQYEQLRSDYENASFEERDHLTGQVSEANQDIRSMQYWNGKWVTDLWFPDTIDDFELIGY